MSPKRQSLVTPDMLALRRELDGSQCSIKRTLDIIGDQWSILVLREAFWGVRRFSDFQQLLNIPRAVLTKRLNSLVEAGILETLAYKELGSRSRNEYVLTDAGLDLRPVLISLLQWGDAHLGQGAVRVIDKNTGKDVRLCITDHRGRPVKPSSVCLIPSNNT